MDDIATLVDAAALAVKQDMERKPVTGADGIWRFDRVCEQVIGKRDRETLRAIERVAREKNARRDTWDREGFGIVASFAQTKAAFMTPGFAEARSKYMT